jgi:hypothetical protein
MRTLRRTPVVAAAFVAVSTTAGAATIQVTLDSVTQNGANYDWHYVATLTAQSQIDGSSIPAAQRRATAFAIRDFYGFIGYSGGPSSWAMQTQLGGPSSLSASAARGGAMDVLFTYDAANGATIDNLAGLTAVRLGTFTLTSSEPFRNMVTGWDASAEARGIDEGSNVLPPGNTPPPPVAVPPPASVPAPEPGTLFLLGLGLAGLARTIRKRSPQA